MAILSSKLTSYYAKSRGRTGKVKYLLTTKKVKTATAKRETLKTKAVVVRNKKSGRFENRDIGKGQVIDMSGDSSWVEQIYNPQKDTVDINLEGGLTTYRFPFDSEDRKQILSSPSPGKAIWEIYGDLNWRN